MLAERDGRSLLDANRPQSIGRVRAFVGNFGVLVRALAYTLAYGPGIRQATEDAVLNANYIRKQLEDVYELPYDSPSMHEVVFSDARQKKFGVNTMDIAKRLIDYGFHPYTTAFPLIVPGALMIEPTESESKEECDLFIDAMRSIAEEAATQPDLVKTAPHTTRVGRLDEVGRRPQAHPALEADRVPQKPPTDSPASAEDILESEAGIRQRCFAGDMPCSGFGASGSCLRIDSSAGDSQAVGTGAPGANGTGACALARRHRRWAARRACRRRHAPRARSPLRAAGADDRQHRAFAFLLKRQRPVASSSQSMHSMSPRRTCSVASRFASG